MSWRSGREEDSFAEEVEVGAAEHLAFDHFDAVDRSLDGAGAVGQGQSGGDGVEISAQAGGEGPQGWGAVGVDPLQPVVEFVAAALGEDLGEGTDLIAGGAKGGAAVQDRVAGATFVVGEA